MTKLRRFEVLLPLKFNDGRPVPDELISTTLAEIEAQFGAVSWETQIIQGSWSSRGTRYRDELFRFFVDVPDLPEHRQFFAELKAPPKVPLSTTRHLDDNASDSRIVSAIH